MWRVFFFLTLFLISGCLFIPVPAAEPEPYDDDLLATLRKGNVSRTDVTDAIGNPNIKRSGGKIWIYDQPRRLAYVAGIFVLPTIDAGVLAAYDFQFLLVEFDQDIVKNVELVEEEVGCSLAGICVVEARIPLRKIGRQKSNYVIISSKQEDDEIAKSFQTFDNMCSIYIYTRDAKANIAIDSSHLIPYTNETYLHLLLKPGSHRFRGPLFAPAYIYDEIMERKIDCHAGDIIFVEQYLNSGIFTKSRYVIDQVTSDIGRESILSKNLLLSNSVDDIQKQRYGGNELLSELPHTCSLQIYRRSNDSRCRHWVEIDQLGAIDTGFQHQYYLDLEMQPGPIVITVQEYMSEHRKQMKMECGANSRHFVKIGIDSRWCLSPTIHIEEVIEEEASPILEDRIAEPFRGNAK